MIPPVAGIGAIRSKPASHKHKMTFVAIANITALRPPTSVGAAFQDTPADAESRFCRDEASVSRAQCGSGRIIVIGS